MKKKTTRNTILDCPPRVRYERFLDELRELGGVQAKRGPAALSDRVHPINGKFGKLLLKYGLKETRLWQI